METILKERFKQNMDRHPGITWESVARRLAENKAALTVLKKMEETGGEPDVLYCDENTGEMIFCDCSGETPAGRRGLCYDEEALRKRKKNPAKGSVEAQVKETGAKLMTEKLYHMLQQTGDYDLKTSSWIDTPKKIRDLGGALFCEKRYETVFTFHNGADSYYSVRGWRGYLRV